MLDNVCEVGPVRVLSDRLSVCIPSLSGWPGPEARNAVGNEIWFADPQAHCVAVLLKRTFSHLGEVAGTFSYLGEVAGTFCSSREPSVYYLV